MGYIKLVESDDWIVRYDPDADTYNVAFFEESLFKDEGIFYSF